jgi:hypothetical protein
MYSWLMTYFFPVLEINYVYVLGVCNKQMVQYIKNWLRASTYTLHIITVRLDELLPLIHLSSCSKQKHGAREAKSPDDAHVML